MLSSLILLTAMSSPSQTPAGGVRFINGANDSGLQILAKSYDEKGGNVMVSPLSIALCLAMVESGARGNTQAGIDRALNWPTAEREAISLAALPLADTLMNAAGEDLRMDIANSVWTNRQIPIRTEFSELVRDRFRARVTSLDFRDAKSSLQAINGWVSQQTRGKIPTILDRIDAGMLMVLVNAVSFKAQWLNQFSPRSTRPLPFTGLDGKSKEVPMMAGGGSVRYHKSNATETVFLPYTAGGYGMAIVLPSKGADFNRFVAGFDSAAFRQISEGANYDRGSYTIPKWTAEFSIDLKRILSGMGMEDAFRATRADFSGMSQMPSHIDFVIHKTFIAVDEYGTEAAAVTATGMRAGSAAPRTPFTFLADRPYMYVIYHEPTGMICFAGTVVKP